jgi:hypothetical protein
MTQTAKARPIGPIATKVIMKRLLFGAVFATAFAAAGLLTPIAAKAETGVSVSFSYFHTRLSPHGRWFSHPRYGRAWRPYGVAAHWRPYTYGRWLWTVDHGWMWVSYYDWGWATFHYGRWVYDPAYGWYWVPGYTWGPAWVAWRYGDGFIGWYPLPPEAVWSPGLGIVYSGVGIYGYYYTPYWVFVPERYFLSTRIYNVVVRSHDNHRFIRNTRRHIHYRRVRNHIFNRGLKPRYIRRVTGRPVVAMRPRVVTKRSNWHRARPGRREVRIFRPPVVERRGARTPGMRRITPGPRGVAPRRRVQPRVQPRAQPRVQPRLQPRVQPRVRPRVQPRLQPRYQPRVQPRRQPRVRPPVRRRVQPRYQPRVQPRVQPRARPRVQPRYQPRARPRVQPRVRPRTQPQPAPRRRIAPPEGNGSTAPFRGPHRPRGHR